MPSHMGMHTCHSCSGTLWLSTRTTGTCWSWSGRGHLSDPGHVEAPAMLHPRLDSRGLHATSLVGHGLCNFYERFLFGAVYFGWIEGTIW